MILLDDIFKEEFYQNSFLPVITSNLFNDSLYPLNEFTAHHMVNKNYSYLKTFATENPSSSLTKEFYNNQYSLLTSTEIDIARSYIDFISSDLAYVFFGSKTLFKSSFFDDFTPSAYDSLISFLSSNDYIKTLGSGHGSAIVFKNEAFSNSFVIPNSQISVDSFVNQYNQIKNDNLYLLQILQQKDQTIATLNQRIVQLQHDYYNASQMTWR